MKKKSWLAGIAAAALLFSACSGAGTGGNQKEAASAAAGSSAETSAAQSGTEAASPEQSGAESAAAGAAEQSGAADAGTGGESGKKDDAAEAQQVIQAPQMTPAEFPVTDGSTATLPLGWMLYRLCTGESQVKAEEAMEFTKTNNSYIRLMDKEADLVIAYEAGPGAKEDERYKDLEIQPIGLDALIFICNSANPVESLTTEQIQDIYTGKVTNWKEVGGEDINIVAFQRKVNSGSQTLMEKLMMKGLPMAEAPMEYRPGEMGELIDGVADFENTGNALGYSVYYYAKNMYTRPNLRFMAVDGILPSAETIRSGEYGYVNPFYAAVRKDEPKDSKARILFDWLTGEDGQSLVEAMDYVSIEKGGKTLPEGIVRELSLQNAPAVENHHRLAVNGMCFDGDAGVVLLDEQFRVSGRDDSIRLRDRDNFALIRGSVIPAEMPVYADAAAKEPPENIPVGLYDVDKKEWVVWPEYDFCYTECMDGTSTVYYFGNWFDYYDEDGNYLGDSVKASFRLYDEKGNFLKEVEYGGDDGMQEVLKNTIRYQTPKHEYDEATGTSTYDLGACRFIDEYDAETGSTRAVLEENGKPVLEASGGSLSPYMLDGVMEDLVPYGWCILDLYRTGIGEDDQYTFEEMDDFLISPEGIRYRLKNRKKSTIVMADEAFLILADYDSGKYEIRDYEDHILQSWIKPEEYEYW